jgi:hypothetical protein
VHVVSWQRLGRLVCGRRNTGQELVDADRAGQCLVLCDKCRRRLDWELRRDAIRRAPKPGLQLTFGFFKEYSVWLNKPKWPSRW